MHGESVIEKYWYVPRWIKFENYMYRIFLNTLQCTPSLKKDDYGDKAMTIEAVS